MKQEKIKKAKEVLSRSQKKNRKVHCVVLRRTYRDVARKDNPAKNLKSCFRVEILRRREGPHRPTEFYITVARETTLSYGVHTVCNYIKMHG